MQDSALNNQPDLIYYNIQPTFKCANFASGRVGISFLV